MKPILSFLGVLALLLVSAPAFAGADTTNASNLAVADGCELDLAAILAAEDINVCSAKPAAPLDLAIGPHCCGSGAANACRDFCRQQGPGCKGTIGCRAGECVCTCSC